MDNLMYKNFIVSIMYCNYDLLHQSFIVSQK